MNDKWIFQTFIPTIRNYGCEKFMVKPRIWIYELNPYTLNDLTLSLYWLLPILKKLLRRDIFFNKLEISIPWEKCDIWIYNSICIIIEKKHKEFKSFIKDEEPNLKYLEKLKKQVINPKFQEVTNDLFKQTILNKITFIESQIQNKQIKRNIELHKLNYIRLIWKLGSIEEINWKIQYLRETDVNLLINNDFYKESEQWFNYIYNPIISVKEFDNIYSKFFKPDIKAELPITKIDPNQFYYYSIREFDESKIGQGISCASVRLVFANKKTLKKEIIDTWKHTKYPQFRRLEVWLDDIDTSTRKLIFKSKRALKTNAYGVPRINLHI